MIEFRIFISRSWFTISGLTLILRFSLIYAVRRSYPIRNLTFDRILFMISQTFKGPNRTQLPTNVSDHEALHVTNVFLASFVHYLPNQQFGQEQAEKLKATQTHAYRLFMSNYLLWHIRC